MITRIAAFALAGSLAFLASRDLAACSCAPPPPPKEALGKASAVFSGKVVRMEKPKPRQGAGPIRPTQAFGKVKVVIQVSRVWKGDLGKEVTLTTNASSAACGYGFRPDEVYLIYCHGEKHALSTNLCTRTKPLADAGEDLTELGVGQEVE